MSSIVLYDENLLRNVVREQLSYTPPAATLNEAMLYEGISSGAVKDAIQFVVGAGAEYGLGGLTLPAAGAGLAVGPTVETMVDAAFAAEEVAGTVSAMSSIGSKLGEYGALWNEAVAAYGGDLKSYYQTLVKIVRQALADLGKKGKDKVEEIAKKLQGAIENLIARLVGALKSGIKLVIPDATIGLAAAKAFEEGLQALSENAFDLLSGAVSKVKMLRDFVSDPSIAVDFFKDVFKQVVELMIAGAKKLEDMSWVKAIMAGGVAGGAALKKLGPTGLEKAAGLIKDKTPAIIKVIDGVLTVLVPTAITAVGLFQILMTDDWKEEDEAVSDEQPDSKEKKKEQLAASYNIRGNSMLISTGRLRKLVREAMDPGLEARAMQEMGEYGPGSLDEWDDGDYLEYLYEIQPEIEYENIPYKATVEYVKARFPEMAKEVDELFSEGGPRVFTPALEAFEDLVDNEHPMAPANLLDGEEQSFRVSDIKREDGEEYRWWIWGNNLDPIDINIAATGTDRDGKTWTAEEMFRDIRGGKASRFKVPKGRGYDLY